MGITYLEVAHAAAPEQTFRLADGSRGVRKEGAALYRYGRRVGAADVVFGEEGDATLLGVKALEAWRPEV